MGLTNDSWKDAVHPSCDSPNTSRRFALGASNVCLVVENPTGFSCRHSRDARVYGHTTTAMHKLSTPPPAPDFRLFSACFTGFLYDLSRFSHLVYTDSNFEHSFLVWFLVFDTYFPDIVSSFFLGILYRYKMSVRVISARFILHLWYHTFVDDTFLLHLRLLIQR